MALHFLVVGWTTKTFQGAEKWISKINGEMNIPRALPPQKAKELTKQAREQGDFTSGDPLSGDRHELHVLFHAGTWRLFGNAISFHQFFNKLVGSCRIKHRNTIWRNLRGELVYILFAIAGRGRRRTRKIGKGGGKTI